MRVKTKLTAFYKELFNCLLFYFRGFVSVMEVGAGWVFAFKMDECCILFM